MYPTTFHPLEHLVLPPEGEHENICSLRVVPVAYQDGTKSMISCWKLTQEELQMVQETGVVYLEILGGAHPPVQIHVDPDQTGLPPVIELTKAQDVDWN